jgi:Flp pilus assembly protein TadG
MSVTHAGPTIDGRRAVGQALAEFALVLPILALLLLTIIQFAFIFAAQLGVTNAVREAARLGAVTTPTLTTAQATGSGGNGAGVYGALTNPTGFLKENVFAYDPASLVTTGAGDTQVCYRHATDTAGKDIIVVQVEASYVHALFIPLLSGILTGLDGDSSDGGMRIGSSEEMRVENDEIVPPYTGGLTATPSCWNP